MLLLNRRKKKKLYLFALFFFLAVGQRTSSKMIYGDTARYPLYANAHVRTMLKSTRMNVFFEF